MSFEKINALIETMEPQEAASAIGRVMQGLFSLLDDEARLEFVMGLVGEPAADKLTSMVHL
jgi:hypothetical protein